MKVMGLKLKVKRLALFFIVLILSGCGYTLQGRETLPFDSVKIGRIENRTYEPKLEDKLHKTLADELMKFGIMISDNAEYVITGVINDIELKTLAEKDEVAVEFEVIIKGKFFLTMPDKTVKDLRRQGAFIVSFHSEGNLQQLMASRELAIGRALKNLSEEIRAGIIYRRYEKQKEKPSTPDLKN